MLHTHVDMLLSDTDSAIMKVMRRMRTVTHVLIVLILIGGAFLVGRFTRGLPLTTTTYLTPGTLPTNLTTDALSPFWEAWDILATEYVSVDGVLPSQDERIWGAIRGLTDSFDDPHTVFLDPSDIEDFNEEVFGNFSGVGMEITTEEDILTVVAPLKGSPAEAAGIRSGDIIIAIDDEPAFDFNVNEAVQLIRGEANTDVTLTVIRDQLLEPLEITITRGVIQLPIVESELRDDGIFVINISIFSPEAAELFADALRNFVLSDSHKLIVDVRRNPGGFLDAAIDMTSRFLPVGKPIVREVFGDMYTAETAPKETVLRSVGYDIFDDSLEMIVLIDEGSASASEIFAGALQEHGVATLVGTQTFGKGSVQQLIELTSNTALKVTIAQWLTPNGVSISDGGLTPDIPVEYTLEDIEAQRDPQFEKAVELLLETFIQ